LRLASLERLERLRGELTRIDLGVCSRVTPALRSDTRDFRSVEAVHAVAVYLRVKLTSEFEATN
jgi:hypothetical protein